ncbi:YhcH/YjgK/YiaL family protein [Bacillus sp. EB106-08-02-XG196]|uniref:YhcH/YjgK/YiaL family protein n=1 Tax=Bacillus sp. EB106-08-02-XG196 TaxID=2737049 RepID=UPI001834E7B1|nr:YhcH/YjgK/YiaL family protein [Bacillus sp. EB106-08-02-XG196]
MVSSLKRRNTQRIAMNLGDVMICLPEDSHLAGIIAGEKQKVRKVVLKVKL